MLLHKPWIVDRAKDVVYLLLNNNKYEGSFNKIYYRFFHYFLFFFVLFCNFKCHLLFIKNRESLEFRYGMSYFLFALNKKVRQTNKILIQRNLDELNKYSPVPYKIGFQF